jgi:archaellum component FlaF (FlaF/FlaG flagellin family)
MKISYLFVALLAFSLGICAAQTLTGVNQTILPTPTAYRVVGQDGDHRLWLRETYEQRADGEVITNLHNVTELATGMNHLVNGVWVASTEDIEILPNGTAAATNGQHQAYFPGDIYNGVIEVVTPDGQHMQSRPLALSYDDGTKTVLIAVLTNSIGQVLGTNQVIYTNAFTGFAADLRYTYTKAGFEQDIVLREEPPVPEAFGMNTENTRLQVLTEFFNTTDPQQTVMPVTPSDGLADTALNFGTMKMVRGKAFEIGDSARKSVAVYKSWQKIQGRTFLVEELPVRAIEAELGQLPLPVPAAPAPNPGGPLINKITPPGGLPPVRLVKTSTKAIQLARADMKYKSGVVLDYVELNNRGPNLFQADTTYWLDGEYSAGAATFEGGTVIKADPAGQMDVDSITNNTTAYRPAIFTSYADDSVGESIDSIDPYYTYSGPTCFDVNTFLNISQSNVVRNMHFYYA